MFSFRGIVPAVMLAGAVMAQTETRPQFEVASIKPAAPDARGMFVRMNPGGRVDITNMTLRELIIMAWQIQPNQLSGGPTWLASARFDISAKSENAPKQGDPPLMIQTLLEDRFQLKMHRETKELSLYALVVARKDGKLGPGLKETTETSCTQPDLTKPLPPPDPSKPPPRYCGNMRMQQRQLTIIGTPIDRLIQPLSRMLARTVIDKTGLTGRYDITLEWGQDETPVVQTASDSPLPAADVQGPSIFTALQEQLGLKLDSQKGPVEVIVIDRAEKPSVN